MEISIEPTNYWANLHMAVQDSVQAGRIGIPVFVRWTVVFGKEKERVDLSEEYLAYYIDLSSNWFSASPIRLSAFKSGTRADINHHTVAVEYDNGAGALIAVARSGSQTHCDLNLLGSSGSIIHKEWIEPLRDGSIGAGGGSDHVAEALKASLRSGQPVNLDASSYKEGGQANG